MLSGSMDGLLPHLVQWKNSGSSDIVFDAYLQWNLIRGGLHIDGWFLKLPNTTWTFIFLKELSPLDIHCKKKKNLFAKLA